MAVLTKNKLTRNGRTLLETAQTTGTDWNVSWENSTTIGSHVTTGNSSGFVDTLVPVDGAVGFLISWAGCSTNHDATVTVSAGDAGRSWQRGRGAYTMTLVSTDDFRGYRYFLGPFESARFGTKSTSEDKAIRIQISASSSSHTSSYLNVMAFQMPTVEYDT